MTQKNDADPVPMGRPAHGILVNGPLNSLFFRKYFIGNFVSWWAPVPA